VSSEKILVVDLDGTLIRSDMLFETFWSAVAADWTAIFGTLRALLHGRAALKRYLAERAVGMDYACLPYEPAVIRLIETWRASGGRVALVSASDQAVVEGVAAHLGLFDEVHGSDGATNLRGAEKAAFLKRRFGVQGFVYAGDSAVDLPVWKSAGASVTVNARKGLQDRVAALHGGAEHIGQPGEGLKPMIILIRPHQWLKNLLVFLPMLGAHQFTTTTLAQSGVAFIAFSLIASAVYVLNDLLDLAADRAHPRKRLRPVASGAVSARRASVLLPALLALTLGLAALAGNWALLQIVAIYFVLSTAYSLYFKHKIVADICILAGFYTLRIVAGAAATGIVLSVWLLAFSVFFFLALAAIKRQAELVDGIAHGRYSFAGRGYRAGDLPIVAGMAISSGYVSVMVLALYINTPDIQQLYSAPNLLWGICLVLLYWIGRVVMVAHRGRMTDDPLIYAVRDHTSRACLALVAGFAIAGAVL
jgi:4-hydroxybenzoate polyprenyltransferase/phosphoserine phosphatase